MFTFNTLKLSEILFKEKKSSHLTFSRDYLMLQGENKLSWYRLRKIYPPINHTVHTRPLETPFVISKKNHLLSMLIIENFLFAPNEKK